MKKGGVMRKSKIKLKKSVFSKKHAAKLKDVILATVIKGLK